MSTTLGRPKPPKLWISKLQRKFKLCPTLICRSVLFKSILLFLFYFSLISQSHLSSTLKTSFEALLVGWYLQITSTTTDHLSEWISQLERRAAENLQNAPNVEYYVSLLEDFIRQIPSVLPSNAEALSLRETNLILSDMIYRGNTAVLLLERLAFLANLQAIERIDDLRLTYSRAVESLSLCFQALEGALREVLEWRNCLLLRAEPVSSSVS